MNNWDRALFIVLVFLAGFAFSASVFSKKISVGHAVQQAIAKCEAELPRNQHCEPVYGARVVEEDK